MMKAVPATGNVTTEDNISLRSRQKSVLSLHVFRNHAHHEDPRRATTKILEAFLSYLRNGNGWTLRNVDLNIVVSRLRPITGSSYIRSITERVSSQQGFDQYEK